MAKQTERKPRGWGAFEALTKKLIRVPKEAVDAQVEAAKRKRRKK